VHAIQFFHINIPTRSNREHAPWAACLCHWSGRWNRAWGTCSAQSGHSCRRRWQRTARWVWLYPTDKEWEGIMWEACRKVKPNEDVWQYDNVLQTQSKRLLCAGDYFALHRQGVLCVLGMTMRCRHRQDASVCLGDYYALQTQTGCLSVFGRLLCAADTDRVPLYVWGMRGRHRQNSSVLGITIGLQTWVCIKGTVLMVDCAKGGVIMVRCQWWDDPSTERGYSKVSRHARGWGKAMLSCRRTERSALEIIKRQGIRV